MVAVLRTGAFGLEGIPGVAVAATTTNSLPLSQNVSALAAWLDSQVSAGGGGRDGAAKRRLRAHRLHHARARPAAPRLGLRRAGGPDRPRRRHRARPGPPLHRDPGGRRAGRGPRRRERAALAEAGLSAGVAQGAAGCDLRPDAACPGLAEQAPAGAGPVPPGRDQDHPQRRSRSLRRLLPGGRAPAARRGSSAPRSSSTTPSHSPARRTCGAAGSPGTRRWRRACSTSASSMAGRKTCAPSACSSWPTAWACR